MTIEIPLEISLPEFRSRLFEPTKEEGEPCFTGNDLRILLENVLVNGEIITCIFIAPGWRFERPIGGQYVDVETVYEACVKCGRIIQPSKAKL